MKPHIVLLDSFAMNPGDLDVSPLQNLGEVTDYHRTTPQQVVKRSLEADVLIINKIKITEDLLDKLPRLKMICVSATGYNIVDIEAAKKRNILVCNAPDYSSSSVAQMVFSLLLHVTNNVAHYEQNNHKGYWSNQPDFCYQDYPTSELAGKTMGIIGMGNIGKRVAQISLAMDMKVLALTSKPQHDLPNGVIKKDIQDLLSEADIVSLHCPQNIDTEHMINTDTLALMKPSAILINTARGGLIDEQAVANALQEGKLLAYAADVMAQEPPPIHHPLLKLHNTFFTPHIAWATIEARKRLFQICYDNIAAFLANRPIHVVNI